MKKYIPMILLIICLLLLIGCGKKEKYEIEILVPAGSSEAFVYSDEEIRPIGNKIKIWAGAGLSDTEVILKPVNENVETGYVAEYLTHGVPVEFDTKNVKDQWFKIGLSVQNDSARGPIAVSVEVEGVEVRIAEGKEKWNCSVTCAEDSADNAYVTTYSNERVVSSTGVLSLQNQNDFDIVVHLLTNGQQERTAEIPAGGVSILYELIEGAEYTVGTHADVPEGTEIFLMVYEGKNAEVY